MSGQKINKRIEMNEFFMDFLITDWYKLGTCEDCETECTGWFFCVMDFVKNNTDEDGDSTTLEEHVMIPEENSK